LSFRDTIERTPFRGYTSEDGGRRWDHVGKELGGLLESGDELAASLVADDRVLLAVTPDKPASEWSVLGVEA
jgi:hypothetical protein